MKTFQNKVRIISNQRLRDDYWHLEFESGEIAKNALPGQFVNLKVSADQSPLLRRPISIHQVKGNKVKLFYEVLGPGTQILSTRKPGESLDLIGPLGNGFSYSKLKKNLKPKNILVAGGMGVAPLVFLAQKLDRPLVVIGARVKAQILCVAEFKALGCRMELATDDGSIGFKGKVTDLLNIILAQDKAAHIFACGPALMLQAVSRVASDHQINAQLSLESHMACGVGACLGCVVSTKSGYRRVCKDGPVFLSQELVW